jgi:hypothetical protein
MTKIHKDTGAKFMTIEYAGMRDETFLMEVIESFLFAHGYTQEAIAKLLEAKVKEIRDE